MKKYAPPPLAIVVIFAFLGLAVYGQIAWYSPNASSPLLVTLVVVLSVPLAFWVYGRIRHLYPTKARRRFACAMIVLFLPMVMCLALGFGAPALALRLMGPDTQMASTVLGKRAQYGRCSREIVLAGFIQALQVRGVCVGVKVFNRAQHGQRVLLNVRHGPFGTLLFSIEPG